jgi:hypothetical protein
MTSVKLPKAQTVTSAVVNMALPLSPWPQANAAFMGLVARGDREVQRRLHASVRV